MFITAVDNLTATGAGSADDRWFNELLLEHSTCGTRMQEQNRTHYKVLKVPPNASVEEIRSSYRTRVLETHPDRVKGKEAEFRRVTEAFKILTDADQREEYDHSLQNLGKAWQREAQYKVADASRVRSYVGSTQSTPSQPSSGGMGRGPTVQDERAFYRARIRPGAPKSQAEFEERVKARAAPVIKIRSGGSMPLVIGGVVLTLVTLVSVLR